MQFSFRRFSHLLRLQFVTNRKIYLLGILAIAGILLCVMLYNVFMSEKGFTYDQQQMYFAIGLILTSVVFVSFVFRQYGGKSQRTQSILLPVSNLEVLAVAMLQSCILFPLVFTGIFLCCSWLANQADVHMMEHFNLYYSLDDKDLPGFFAAHFLVLSIALLCAVWFRRYTFVKTAALICLIFVGIGVLNNVFSRMIVGNAQPADFSSVEILKRKDQQMVKTFMLTGDSPFSSLHFDGKTVEGLRMQYSYVVRLPVSQSIPFLVFFALTPFFFLFLTWLKLQEQEL